MTHPQPRILPSAHPAEIPYEIRDQHVYVPGKTRHGKTTMLHRMIVGDIWNWAGVTVLDPKGDLVRSLLDYIPPHRKDDCIYLDLDSPVPLDFMGFKGDREKEDLVGDLKYIIEKGDTTLTRADAILEDLCYTLLAIPDASFIDIYRFFRHEERKREILDALKPLDQELWDRWNKEFPTPTEWKPIASRINKFWRNPSLRSIFGDPHPHLRISEVMDGRKILLVNLGGAGESKSIYGSILVSKFLQAAKRRHNVPVQKRIPHFFYIDEFEYFQTSSFAEIFSLAGGYGLRLTVGNQFIGQLDEMVRRSIFGNAGTFIVFKIGEDVNLFKNVAYPYDPDELARLPKYQAMYKIGDRQPIFKWTQDQLPKPSHVSFAAEIIEATSARYGTKRAVDNTGCPQPKTMVQSKEDVPNSTTPSALLPDDPED